MLALISPLVLGLFTGFLLSIPVGPINLTVINEALRKGFTRAALIGLGGVMADTFYCATAFLGFSPLLSKLQALWPYLQFMGGIAVFVIGIRYSLDPVADVPAIAQSSESKIGHHFTKAFPIGFFMGISNLALFILWGGVNTLFISHGWLEPHLRSMLLCIAGVWLGSSTWFVAVSFLVAKMHRQVEPDWIARISRVCGILMVVFGVILCYRAVFGTKAHFF